MGFRSPWSLTAKLCDSCKSAAAAVFCRADSAALCLSCDTKIHNKLTRPHGRVWMCEVCEHAPAAVTCKADAAVLCVTCDADIHSANPLASRHERFPVDPFFEAAESMVARSTAFNFLALPEDSSGGGACPHNDAEVEADAWLIHGGGAAAADVHKAGDFSAIFNGNDPFLDFEYGIAVENRQFHCSGNDGLVPVKDPVLQPPVLSPENAPFKFEFCGSDNNKKLSSSFSFQLGQHSVGHSASSSSLEVGVVPDGNCNSLSDNSYPLVQSSCAGPDPTSITTSQPGPATQLYGMDREARVLRYREKRKNRKFEKTIRYASRKAYAETRPRIKGRFAKRTEADMEDSICTSTQYYGVVPTF